MSFFDSKEYLDFKKVHTRIQERGGNTLKNLDIYAKRFAAAIKLCEEKYDNIGFYFDGWKPSYKWAPSPKLSEANYDQNDIKMHMIAQTPKPEYIQEGMFDDKKITNNAIVANTMS